MTIYQSRAYRVFMWVLIKVRAAVEWPLGHFSRVGDHACFDNRYFPWAETLARHTDAIEQECRAVTANPDDVPAFVDIAPEQSKISGDKKWKTYFLMAYKSPMPPNIARCPATFQALQCIPGLSTAFFSILEPGKHLPPHRGPYKGLLRCHLGLSIPEPREQCGIRVDNQTYHWRRGEVFIFDDSYEHEAWNDTGQARVILFVDFERPLPKWLQPFNRFFIHLVRISPKIQTAKKRLLAWEAKRSSK